MRDGKIIHFDRERRRRSIADSQKSSNRLFDREINIASVSVLIRFLAVFHRAFAAIYRFGKEQDKEGIFMGGWLANRIHNVPEMLAYHVPGSLYSAAELDSGLFGFPAFMAEFGVSERIVKETERITTRNHAARDLGIANLDSDVCVAPPAKFDEYAQVLYLTCILTRNRQFDARTSWTQEDMDKGIAAAALVHALQPIPAALVRWEQFNEGQFRKRVEDAYEQAENGPELRGLDAARDLLESFVSTGG